MQEDGIDTERLEQLLRTTPGVKLIYTIPTFQNPLRPHHVPFAPPPAAGAG